MNENRNIKVAIIDSGFTESYRSLNNSMLTKYCMNISKESSDIADEYGHGTGIMSIIDCLCDGIEFIVIKVLDQNCRGTSEKLLEALQKAILLEVDVINLSLGTSDRMYYERFQRLCTEAWEKDISVVVTCENENEECLPFLCEGTIKVLAMRYIKEDTICYKEGIFYAKGVEHLIPWLHHSYIYSGSNSFSTPYIIKEVVNLKKRGYNQSKKVLSELVKASQSLDEINFLYINKEEDYNIKLYSTIKQVVEEVLNVKIGDRRLSLLGMSVENSIRILKGIESALGIRLYYEKFNYIDFEYVENITKRVEESIRSGKIDEYQR